MTLCNLRFAGFMWQVNPYKLYVDRKRLTTRYTTLGSGEVIGNICEGIDTVSGEGEFAGSDCIARYEKLEKLYRENRRGLLTLPGMKPFYAYFTELSMLGDDTPSVVRYKFGFVRDSKENFSRKYHICKEDESLFEIADLYGTDLMKLVKLNPRLSRADGLKEGEKVALC